LGFYQPVNQPQIYAVLKAHHKEVSMADHNHNIKDWSEFKHTSDE